MTNLAPGQNPAGGGQVETGPPSGDGHNPQYHMSLFGFSGAQFADSGAPGSQGASPTDASTDPTNQPGQLDEGISGIDASANAHSGAPGTMGAQNGGAGPDRVTYTEPGSFLSGTNTSATVNDSISGPGDWTQAIDGSYGGSVNLPSITGNQPQAGSGPYQPGSGRVRHGGFMNGQR